MQAAHVTNIHLVFNGWRNPRGKEFRLTDNTHYYHHEQRSSKRGTNQIQIKPASNGEVKQWEWSPFLIFIAQSVMRTKLHWGSTHFGVTETTAKWTHFLSINQQTKDKWETLKNNNNKTTTEDELKAHSTHENNTGTFSLAAAIKFPRTVAKSGLGLIYLITRLLQKTRTCPPTSTSLCSIGPILKQFLTMPIVA